MSDAYTKVECPPILSWMHTRITNLGLVLDYNSHLDGSLRIMLQLPFGASSCESRDDKVSMN